MDISPTGLARSIIPKTPLIIKTTVLAIFGYSANSPIQDFLTEVIVVLARPVLGAPAGLLKSQKFFSTDWNSVFGIWGRMWIAKYIIPPPEIDFNENDHVLGVREALSRAILELGDGQQTCLVPDVLDVETEWTGYREGVSNIARRPKISEQEQYARMMEEVDPDSPTVLYFHGGAFCLMDPATHRLATSGLARDSRGRCLSVRYRLSPQNPFPAALLDALISYLSLLSPPPGSFHSPVPPSRIIIAGDSSGGGVGAALLLLLLTISRLGITHIRFHGRNVPITATPAAGLAIVSPWLDVSRSLPSVYSNARYDIIAPPSSDPSINVASPNFPPDSIWPAQPPRVETYCDANMIIHPLVSPLAASPELWTGAPPVYVNVGWESMQDEAEVFARRVYSAGVPVIFDGFEGMPHCFAVFPWNAAGKMAFKDWAEFCSQAVRRGGIKKREHGTWVDKHGGVKPVELKSLGMRPKDGKSERTIDLDDLTVGRLMMKQREWRVRLEEEMRTEWKLNRPSARTFTITAIFAWIINFFVAFVTLLIGKRKNHSDQGRYIMITKEIDG